MFVFLQERLREEVRFQRHQTSFDNRNCFYIAQSLEKIAKELKITGSISVPDGYELDPYEHFAKEIARIGRKVLTKASTNINKAGH